MTLIEFLKARLAEEEAAALAAIDVQEEIYPAPGFEVRYEWSRLTQHVSGGCGMESVPGAPSPSRVLRDVVAKQRIADLHGPLPFRSLSDRGLAEDFSYRCRICDQFPAQYPCSTIRELAYVYRDHPEFQEEWMS